MNPVRMVFSVRKWARLSYQTGILTSSKVGLQRIF